MPVSFGRRHTEVRTLHPITTEPLRFDRLDLLLDWDVIYAIDSGKIIREIPYRDEYDVWRGRLSTPEYEAIIGDLMSKIGATNIQTSSWMPGKNWANTVYAPIYSKACNSDYTEAAKFFGLFVWEAFLLHSDYWSFGRYELDGIPIQGLTYFKVVPR